MKLDFGVMFSDGNDGTAPAYKSLVPKNAADGTTVATPVTANMNDVFYSAGSVVNFGAGAQKAIPWTDITYTNAAAGLTIAPMLLTAMQTPVINLFNFASNGQAWSDGGWMDVYVRVEAAPTTPAAANLIGRLWYVL